MEERSDYSHVALHCDAAEFEALAARIGEVARIWKENRSDGASLYFLDPDGHRMELHAGTLESRLAHYRANTDKGVTVLDAPVD